MTCIGKGDKDIPIHLLDTNDEGVFQLLCSHGHKSIFVSQQPKFCLLAEMGMLACRDAYYRESIFNFSSSLERFMEYYVHVIANAMNIRSRCYDDTWKIMAKQSERQMGAFLATYMISNKSVPPVLSNSFIELRNKVVHKGYIPTFDDAKGYAEAVLSIVTEEYKKLQQKHPIGIEQLLSERKEKMNTKYSPGQDAAVIGSNTIIDHMISGSYNFDSYLKFLHGTQKRGLCAEEAG